MSRRLSAWRFQHKGVVVTLYAYTQEAAEAMFEKWKAKQA